MVLELYLAHGEPDQTRLDFTRQGDGYHLVEDPDGRKVELNGDFNL